MKLVNRDYSSSQSGKLIKRLVALIVLVLVVGGIFFLFSKVSLFGKAPHLVLQASSSGKSYGATDTISLGKTGGLKAVVTNESKGICSVSLTLSQNGKKIIILSRQASSAEKVKNQNWELSPQNLDLVSQGFTEGAAELEAVAQDCSLWGLKTKINQVASLDFSPPQISLTSSQHYIYQGAAEVMTYTVSPDAVWSGCQVGPYEFKGFKVPASPEGSGNRFVMLTYAYDLPADSKIELLAFDAAGNIGKASVPVSKFFPKEYRHRDMPVSDDFIQTKVATIINNTPELHTTGKPLDDFLMVNRDLRKKNAGFLKELSQKSEEQFYWKDAFKPLLNAAVEANFADYRSYIYNGQKVDEQVHLGFDLAITEQSPVTVGNSGKVVFAGYLGIYGNTIIIDHGYGLQTLYGHLSSMDVAVGQMVSKNQKIGNSGQTGLAGGDHLHFSLLNQGVQTDPVSFWDQHWIDDHVYLRVDKTHFAGTINP